MLSKCVVQAAEVDPDLFFTDQPRGASLGRRNAECLSIFADSAPRALLVGTSPFFLILQDMRSLLCPRGAAATRCSGAWLGLGGHITSCSTHRLYCAGAGPVSHSMLLQICVQLLEQLHGQASSQHAIPQAAELSCLLVLGRAGRP